MSKLLIAESGATKTEWRYVENNQLKKAFRTRGFNPTIQGFDEIESILHTEVIPQLGENKLQMVNFYGAGLSSSEAKYNVQERISRLLNCQNVEVESDLLAAARASAGREEGIICILGTGSNSCFYDGSEIVYEIGGNGYIFGDEGSGADMGKRLLKAILDKDLPQHLCTEFETKMGLSILEIRNKVYSHKNPNVFLASFTRFIAEHQQNSLIQSLIYNSLRDFILKTVTQYLEFQEQQVHFVGSIASIFQPSLLSICHNYVINVGKIIQSPIENLLDYHLLPYNAEPIHH